MKKRLSSVALAAARSSDRWVKGLFVAAVLLFPLQYWFAKHVSEPYPALMMPEFAGAVVNADGQFSAPVADVVIRFRDGTSRTITLRTLFADAPSSQFQAMANNALRPRKRPPPPDNIWGGADLGGFIRRRVVPGYTINKLHRWYWAGVEPATVAWLRDRIHELCPDRQAERVDVLWYAEVYLWRDGRVSRCREPLDMVSIEL